MSQDNTTEPACAARGRLEVELHAAHEVIKQLRAEIADLKGRIAWRHRHGFVRVWWEPVERKRGPYGWEYGLKDERHG